MRTRLLPLAFVVAFTPLAATAQLPGAPGGSSSGTIGRAPKAVKVEVAGILKPYDAIVKPAPEAIPFLTPAGPSTRRGRGLLLKNDPGAGRRGTTWTFGLMRKSPHRGVQIVHPCGDGQIIVHLRDEGVFLVSPAEMVKTPWVGGDPKAIKPSGINKVFPLEGQNYAVVSRLSGSGQYTISINGKVVGRASLTPGPALDLSASAEFAGERLPAGVEFPLKWGPGYAALITGGVDDGGVLNCRDAIFEIGAALPAP